MRRQLLGIVSGLLAATAASEAFARGGGARVQYPGSHPTTSHGGHCSCGEGAWHDGGSDRNGATGNRYGRHR